MYIVAHKIHVRTKANNIETKIKFKNLNWSEVNQLAINIYWAACAPSHKMGFRSSVSKSGLPGEGRHEGLVPRNDVVTNGFI